MGVYNNILLLMHCPRVLFVESPILFIIPAFQHLEGSHHGIPRTKQLHVGCARGFLGGNCQRCSPSALKHPENKDVRNPVRKPTTIGVISVIPYLRESCKSGNKKGITAILWRSLKSSFPSPIRSDVSPKMWKSEGPLCFHSPIMQHPFQEPHSVEARVGFFGSHEPVESPGFDG